MATVGESFGEVHGKIVLTERTISTELEAGLTSDDDEEATQVDHGPVSELVRSTLKPHKYSK